VELVRKLARVEPDVRIASILNRNQRRTAHWQVWTANRRAFAIRRCLITFHLATELAVGKKGNQLLKDAVPMVHAPSSAVAAGASMPPRTFQIAARQKAP